MPKRLEHYFPTVAQHRVREPTAGSFVDGDVRTANGKQALEGIPTKWRVILTLEMQGAPKCDIAQQVGMSAAAISEITRDDRYIAFRDEYLATIDNEFFAMKPLAFKALRNGLTSGDEDTALKAADQWFRGASFGGFSKREERPTNLTAEDVVRQLLQVNVQVNVNSDGE